MHLNDKISFLLVEDNDLDVEKVERGLKRLKIKNPVLRASDGCEALDYLYGKNGKEKIKKPFIILLDINMPKMNGHEFLEELRKDEDYSNTNVFVLTTSESKQDIERAYKKNVSGYIVKPIERAQMLEALEVLNAYWCLCKFPENGHAV